VLSIVRAIRAPGEMEDSGGFGEGAFLFWLDDLGTETARLSGAATPTRTRDANQVA